MAIAARLNTGETMAGRILKVDHAGEHGAVNIYRGQRFVCRWRAPDLIPELQEFQSHEEQHRAIFGQQLRRRGLRRCRSYHFCGLGGLLLGLSTGLCGRSAVAATTFAVERVVLRHLEEQLDYLSDADSEAFMAVSSIIEDERTHHDRAAFAAEKGRFWPRLLLPCVSAATSSVIWMGMRL